MHTQGWNPVRFASAQAQSAKVMGVAQDAQKRAADQEHRAEAAEARVKDLKSQLAEAQTRSAQERAKAQQVQHDALQQNQQANREATVAQRQAIASEQQIAVTSSHEGTTVLGTLTAQSDHEVTVQRSDTGRALRLQVGDKTHVTINGQPVQLQQIPEGSQVRASFVPGEGLPLPS